MQCLFVGGEKTALSVSNERVIDLNGEQVGEEMGDATPNEFEPNVVDEFNGFWGEGLSTGENECIGGVEQEKVTAEIILPKDW